MEVKCFDKFDELFPEELQDEMNARDRLDTLEAKRVLKA
jgi:hypothetical protein